MNSLRTARQRVESIRSETNVNIKVLVKTNLFDFSDESVDRKKQNVFIRPKRSCV